MVAQTPAIGLERTGPGRISRTLQLLRGVPVIPVIIIVIVLFSGIFADVIVPHDPEVPDPLLRLQPPAWQEGGSWDYPLGTDPVGRDMLSRLIAGARVSLIIGATVVFIAGGIGTTLALVSGYFRGIPDMIISRLTDAVISMPFLVIAVAAAGILGASMRNLILILGLLSWAGYARILRGEVLRISQLDFVTLARITGVPSWRILAFHIFPNIVNTLVVLATLQLGTTIIAASSLDFLGLGIPPPTSTWGGTLSEGRTYIRQSWWVVTMPGIVIALTVMATNLMGDWLRLKLDPKRRGL
ncbi:MAG: ABC transporter permease [Dehalococcoidia bacterium]|nr:ABC transporter permease [Dehalococcoidia bacterium]